MTIKGSDLKSKRELAWIGDAVLALYARQWILKQSDIKPGERTNAFIHMTGNQFLACIGEPTGLEAEIGELYQKSGIEAAFEYIECSLLPTYLKQRNNRKQSRR